VTENHAYTAEGSDGKRTITLTTTVGRKNKIPIHRKKSLAFDMARDFIL
jgi:hypothetical protein